jgi:hypothetical protein
MFIFEKKLQKIGIWTNLKNVHMWKKFGFERILKKCSYVIFLDLNKKLNLNKFEYYRDFKNKQKKKKWNEKAKHKKKITKEKEKKETQKTSNKSQAES